MIIIFLVTGILLMMSLSEDPQLQAGGRCLEWWTPTWTHSCSASGKKIKDHKDAIMIRYIYWDVGYKIFRNIQIYFIVGSLTISSLTQMEQPSNKPAQRFRPTAAGLNNKKYNKSQSYRQTVFNYRDKQTILRVSTFNRLRHFAMSRWLWMEPPSNATKW